MACSIAKMNFIYDLKTTILMIYDCTKKFTIVTVQYLILFIKI